MATTLLFRRGDLTKIADWSGISKQHLCDCMRGRRQIRSAFIPDLVRAAAKLGYVTEPYDWLFPTTTENELFVNYRRS